jgi:hypothetical protein
MEAVRTEIGIPWTDTRTFFERWVEEEQGLPLHRGLFIERLFGRERGHWERLGAEVAFFDLVGAESLGGCYAMELAPGRQTKPLRSLYDEVLYVVAGRGGARIETGGRVVTFEWGPRSLFGIPLNARWTLFNGSGSEPARLVSVNTMPIVLSVYRDERFVFETEHDFGRLPDGQTADQAVLYRPDPEHRLTAVDLWETLFVPDIFSVQRSNFREHGEGSKNVYFELANSPISAHVAEQTPGRFFRPHRHGPSAFIFTLSGAAGYSLLWPDGGEVQRFDWPDDDVGVIVPPNQWWHGHFPVRAPLVHLALKLQSRKFRLNHLFDGVHKTLDEGGTIARYADLPEALRQRVWQAYAGECARHGVEVHEPD